MAIGSVRGRRESAVLGANVAANGKSRVARDRAGQAPSQALASAGGACDTVERSMSSHPSRASAIRHLGGSGEPMVLMHGFALSADSWKPIVRDLVQRHSVHAGTYHGHFGGAPLPPNFRPSIA